MTWFDGAALVLIILAIWLESLRGFGQALLDLVAAVLVVRVVASLSVPLAQNFLLTADVNANRALWYAISLVMLGALALLASRLAHASTLLSLDSFDPVLGGVLGCGSGLVLAFAFLHAMQIDYGSTAAGQQLLHSVAGQELIEFRSLRWVMDTLGQLGSV